MSARTTRRHLLGASAAMLLLAAPAAGAAKAQELDGELLDACARFMALHTRHDLLNVVGSDVIDDDEADEIVAEWVNLRNEVVALPARTPEGLQAKAAVAFMALRDKACLRPWQEAPWPAQVHETERLALECLAAVAGIEA